MTGAIEPEYQRLMRQIRSRITSGEYPLGAPIPSTARLASETGMSVPVVRRAVDLLKADRILEGHPGKGVFVRALPAEADAERADLKVVSEQLADLAGRVQDYDDLRAKVNLLEAVVINLCAKANVEYPHGGARDNAEKAAGRGRARRA